MNGNTFTKYTQYTVKELESYVADPETCVQKLQWNDLISVLPKYLGNICEGVRIYLDQKIGKYDRKVDGIILAYKNTQIHGPLTAIRPNSFSTHAKISADFYVFRPQSGSVISGIAKYVSNNYISAVIYRVFNVTIKFRTQNTRSITRGSCIKFVIKTYDIKSEIPFIEGELIGNPTSQKHLPNGNAKPCNGQKPKIKIESPPPKCSGNNSDQEKIEDESDAHSQQTQQISSNDEKQKSKRKRVKLEKDATKPLGNGVANEQLTKDSLADLNEDDEPQDDEMEHSIRAILSGFEQEINGSAEDDSSTLLSASSSKPVKKKKRKSKDLASLEAEVLLKFAAQCDEPDTPAVIDQPSKASASTSKVEKTKKRKKKKQSAEEDNFEASIMSSLLKCAAEADDDSDDKRSAPLKKARKSVRFDSTITEASFNMFDSSEQLEISQLVSQALSSTMNDDEDE